MIKLKIEIADTPAKLAQGLMLRSRLPDNHGMLFKFPMTLEASFWGKDTYIPLDVAFIDNEDVITGIKQIVPMSTRSVRSDGYCKMAIEANAGFFDRQGIKPGYRVKINKVDGVESEAVFEKK